MRRGAFVVVLIGVALLLGSYVFLTQRVVQELRRDASLSGLMYGEVWRALTDTTADPQSALLDISRHVVESGVPFILTDADGRPYAMANIGLDSVDDPRVRDWIVRLDKENPPIVVPNAVTVHFGHTPLVRGLQVIPALQAGMLALLILAGVLVLRTRAHADRERVWAGMARESAHQLGTPLSSLSGWIELLGDQTGEEGPARSAIEHMSGDLERLERVAHRFERIGRPPQRRRVDVSDILARVARYFAARVPTLAHSVTVETRIDETLPLQGDPVLMEWAIEALVKNAVDALAGRGGHVVVEGRRLPEGDVRVRVSDDGPGVPRELRRRIFDAGFSTKQRGWGIGLALAKRIVEEAHKGSLVLVPSDRGATFEIIFPA